MASIFIMASILAAPDLGLHLFRVATILLYPGSPPLWIFPKASSHLNRRKLKGPGPRTPPSINGARLISGFALLAIHKTCHARPVEHLPPMWKQAGSGCLRIRCLLIRCLLIRCLRINGGQLICNLRLLFCGFASIKYKTGTLAILKGTTLFRLNNGKYQPNQKYCKIFFLLSSQNY